MAAFSLPFFLKEGSDVGILGVYPASIRSLKAACIQTSRSFASISSFVKEFRPITVNTQFHLTVGMWSGISLRDLRPSALSVGRINASVTMWVVTLGSYSGKRFPPYFTI